MTRSHPDEEFYLSINNPRAELRGRCHDMPSIEDLSSLVLFYIILFLVAV